MEESKTTAIGPYRLGRALGEGGMGTVYLAEQEEPFRRRVALKLIRPCLDTQEVIARFEAERQAMALMDHPNIAKVLDAGTTSAGQPYFVMEWVNGEAITQYCNSRHLTVQERLKIFVDACRGIQHAHQKAIIHRDLKPSNILVTFRDGQHVPKVIDFGIAKALGAQSLTDKTLHTQWGQFVGTPQYISPEQADSQAYDVDTRTDVYSLGAILYELLTDVPPLDFDEADRGGVLRIQRQILETEPIKPSARLEKLDARLAEVASDRGTTPELLRRAIIGDLDWVTMKALAKDRDQRYGTANLLATEIDRVMCCEPVLAGPPSVRYRLRKFTQRNRLMVGAVIMVVLALVIGTIVSAWQAIRATQYATLANKRLISEQMAVQRANAATQRAETAQLRSQEAFAQSDYQTGQQLAAQGDYGPALAYLSRSLERLPNNPAAADRIYSILTQSDHPWQICAPLPHQSTVALIALSSDGSLAATATAAGEVALWKPNRPSELIWTINYGATPSCLHFTPDDQFLLLGGYEGCCQIAVTDGEIHRSIAATEQENWLGLTFSADGSRVLTRSWIMGAALWDTSTLTPILHLDHRYLRTAIFSHDEQLILTTSQTERDACLWKTSDGTLLKHYHHTGEVWNGFFTNDDANVMITTGEGRAYLWTIEDDTKPKQVFDHGTKSTVRSAALSPSANLLITGSTDRTARVWDLETGIEKTRLIGGSEFIALGFMKDDRMFTVEQAGKLRIWQMDSDQALPQFNIELGGLVHDVSWHSDSNQLAVAGDTSVQARVYQLSSRCPSLLLPQSDVTCATLTSDGKTVVLGTARGSLTRFDSSSGEPLATHAHRAPITAVAKHPSDSEQVCAGTVDGDLLLWKIGSEPLTDISLSDEPIEFLCYDPNGHFIAAASETTAYILSANGTPTSITPLHQVGKITALAFHPNGTQLLLGSDTGIAQVWDLAGSPKVALILKHHGRLRAAQWSPDGTIIATGFDYSSGTGDRTIQLWSAANGKPLGAAVRHPGSVNAFDFSPDGQWLAVANSNGVVVWHTQSQERHLRLEESHFVPDARFSPDGARLGILALDKGVPSLTLWDAQSGDPLSERLPLAGTAHALSFTPDSQRLMAYPTGHHSMNNDEVVRIWPITLNHATTQLPPEWSTSVSSIGGVGFDALGKLKPISPAASALINPAQTPFDVFAKWISSPPQQRQPHPFAKATTRAYQDALSEQFGPPFIRQLGDLDPHMSRLRAERAALHPALADRTQESLYQRCQHDMQIARLQSPDDLVIRFLEAIMFDRMGQMSRALSLCTKIIGNEQVPLTLLLAMIDLCDKARTDYPIKKELYLHVFSTRRAALSESQYWQLRHRFLELNIATGFFDRAVEDWQDLVKYPEWIQRKGSMSLLDRLIRAAEVRADVERNLGNGAKAKDLLQLSILYRDFRYAMEPNRQHAEFAQRARDSLLVDFEMPVPNTPETEAVAQSLARLLELTIGLPAEHPLHQLDLCYRSDSAQMPLPVEQHLALWTARAQLQSGLQRSLDDTCRELLEWLEQAPSLTWPSDPAAHISMVAHARLLERAYDLSGQHDRATATRQWLADPAPRPVTTDPRAIDLTSHYNASLHDERTWHGDVHRKLTSLPITLEKNAKHRHDARGAIQLAGFATTHAANGKAYPQQLSEIAVQRTSLHVHLLMGVMNGKTDIGVPILHVFMHYADGSQQVLDVRYDEHVIDWQSSWIPNPEMTIFHETSPGGTTVLLTEVSLVNPHPDKRIESLDIRSARATAAPFVLAITTE